MSRFGSFEQPQRPTLFSGVQGVGFVCMCLCFWVCVSGEGGLTCWRLTQEHVPPLDDQNMSISLRCFNTNPLWGMSETYLHLNLRWRVLNRQFISLSHFRLCFLADKWHLLPKQSGWSFLQATTALLGWAPNIHHSTSCLHVCLCSSLISVWAKGFRGERLQLSICCLVPKLVTERLRGGWSPPTASSSALMQCSNTTALSNRMQTWPRSEPLSSVGSCRAMTPEISCGNYKYEAATPFTFWQIQ